jgi:hypothetical protein
MNVRRVESLQPQRFSIEPSVAKIPEEERGVRELEEKMVAARGFEPRTTRI